LRPSPHNWRSGATNWCMRGGSVFQIIFNSGQALPLPGGRFSFPRIGRGGDTERLRNMYRSWPQTRPGHGHDPVQCRTRTQTVRVHEPSTAVNSPRPRSWPQTVRKHGLATDSIVPKPATVAVADCPQSGQSRGPSTTANWSWTRFVRSRRPAINYPRRSIALSAWASASFPFQIPMIPIYDHV
jgi:hypothetical protein